MAATICLVNSKSSTLIIVSTLILLLGIGQTLGGDYEGYLDINGNIYFLNTSFHTKDSAINVCRSINMQTISFEEPGKWEEMKAFMEANPQQPFSSAYFWIGAEKASRSPDFLWDFSHRKVLEFPWADFYPQHDPNNVTNKICLEFNVLNFNGWMDNLNCGYAYSGIMCQSTEEDK